jgi:TctA family transporter
MEERLALRGHAAGISLRVVLAVWKDLPKYWGDAAAFFLHRLLARYHPGWRDCLRRSWATTSPSAFPRTRTALARAASKGVFAPETAAHASGTAALLPMLALGIPGSGTAAILLGGLDGVGASTPVRCCSSSTRISSGALIASMYLGNVVGLVLVLTTVPIFASILRVPFAAVAPMIVVSCAIGAYAIQNAMFDIWLMLGFGVVGYVFKKIGIPLAPFTLALVLGNRAEDAFRLSMIGSGGDMKVFWSNGLVGSITTLAIVLLFWPVIDKVFGSVTRMLRPAKA